MLQKYVLQHRRRAFRRRYRRLARICLIRSGSPLGGKIRRIAASASKRSAYGKDFAVREMVHDYDVVECGHHRAGASWK